MRLTENAGGAIFLRPAREPARASNQPAAVFSVSAASEAGWANRRSDFIQEARMADNPARVTRASFEKAVVGLAEKDEAFRKTLLANPRQALKDGGFGLPVGVDLRGVEEGPGVFYLVLPAKAAEGELADQDLANVAGGLGTLTTTQTATLAPQSTLSSSLLVSSPPLQGMSTADAAARMPDPNLAGIKVSWG
jgi:hypothetical protein